MTAKYREKLLLNNVTVDCPHHGRRKTYGLIGYNEQKGYTAVGCEKCFENLPIIPKKPHYEKDRRSL